MIHGRKFEMSKQGVFMKVKSDLEQLERQRSQISGAIYEQDDLVGDMGVETADGKQSSWHSAIVSAWDS